MRAASSPTLMSAPRFRLVLTKRAQRDSRNIYLYTLGTWGAEQAIVDEAAFDKVYGLLQKNPRLGRERPELRPGLMSFPVEHHVLFYRIKGEVIEIARILHERADHARHFR